MAKTWNYNEDKTRILIEPPKQRLRITGHRIATILGLDPWSTPFQAWCEITKILKAPFEETKYTIAGKAAEPKIIQYVAERFPNVLSIEDYYGNVFKEYEYNNFKDISNVFGGVIDAVSTKNDGKTIAMICECKTSSHPEQWQDGNVPVTYLLQGALYSYLMGLDRVLFACTFLDDLDYAHPENIKVTDENTILVVKKLDDMIFEVDGQYLNIEGVMEWAEQWWDEHIEKGVSPKFDEKKDKEYLTMIRATDEVKDNDLADVCDEAIELNAKIKELKESSGINALEKRLKQLEASIKNEMIEQGYDKCNGYTLKRTVKQKFNEDLFAEKEPAKYEKYLEEVESYTLSKDKKKEEE